MARKLEQREHAAIKIDNGTTGPAVFRVSAVKEGDKYRSMAQRLREQADLQHDRAISEQYRKIADRYDELAAQVEATARRAD